MKRLYRPPPWRVVLLSTAAAACCGLALAPARADEKADALLAKAKAAYKAATSLTATLSSSMSHGTQKFTQSGTLQLRKPNLARIELTAPQKTSVLSDGNNVYILMPDNQYIKQRAVQSGLGRAESLGGLLTALFFGHDSYGFGSLSGVGVVKKYGGKETVGGVQYDVVALTVKTPVAHTLKIYIGADGLIGQSVAEITAQDNKLQQVSEWKGQRLNGVPATTSFAVVLPKNATLFKQPEQPDYTAKFVAVGKTAPVFAVPSPTGGSVSLADSAADHKAVLVNFWFYG